MINNIITTLILSFNMKERKNKVFWTDNEYLLNKYIFFLYLKII
jgi:hypothetical protein